MRRLALLAALLLALAAPVTAQDLYESPGVYTSAIPVSPWPDPDAYPCSWAQAVFYVEVPDVRAGDLLDARVRLDFVGHPFDHPAFVTGVIHFYRFVGDDADDWCFGNYLGNDVFSVPTHPYLTLTPWELWIADRDYPRVQVMYVVRAGSSAATWAPIQYVTVPTNSGYKLAVLRWRRP